MLMFSNQAKVFFVGGPNQRDDFHLELGEEVWWRYYSGRGPILRCPAAVLPAGWGTGPLGGGARPAPLCQSQGRPDVPAARAGPPFPTSLPQLPRDCSGAS
ncbi:HAAO [Cordylochernes scorpioides]|uniref:HAAO n=1 Tax=Cordylochernes scorpioides TaxID=51811 RepID=A0ABY6LPH0_9ARAC|nr:HAAO [Cordylochernes scorpioides]